MSITAIVENGTIKLPADVHIPDGTPVRIEPMEENAPTLAERLASFIGVAKDLPPDLAENHDHYLYGTAKRKP